MSIYLTGLKKPYDSNPAVNGSEDLERELLIKRTEDVRAKIIEESSSTSQITHPRPSRRTITQFLPKISNLSTQNSRATFLSPSDFAEEKQLTEHLSPSKKAAKKLEGLGFGNNETSLVKQERFARRSLDAVLDQSSSISQLSNEAFLPRLLIPPSLTMEKPISSKHTDKQLQPLVLKGNEEKLARKSLDAFLGKSKKSLSKSLLPPIANKTSTSTTSSTASSTMMEQKRWVERFIDSCKSQFFDFAKRNSLNTSLTMDEFNQSFYAFRDVLLNLESKDFLDSYIVRDSTVGMNKDQGVRRK